ncbi:MAG: T9SS type A sorting domain-containing protein [Bacteroidetes bacterium]|nr:T9SS type A sorting domain-containing protein [Bacteroidota bacterium]
MYPNPANNIINIESENYINRVFLFDLNGTLILEFHNQSNHATINIENLLSGFYVVKMFTNDNIITKKLSVIKN